LPFPSVMLSKNWQDASERHLDPTDPGEDPTGQHTYSKGATPFHATGLKHCGAAADFDGSAVPLSKPEDVDSEGLPVCCQVADLAGTFVLQVRFSGQLVEMFGIPIVSIQFSGIIYYFP
jgi:hypothetical protein